MTIGVGGHDFVDIVSVFFCVSFEFVRQRVVTRGQAVVRCTLKYRDMGGLLGDFGNRLNAG